MESGPRPVALRPGSPDGTTLELARRVLRIEAAAVDALADRLDRHFEAAIGLLLSGAGRVIATGMGKSGIIARKLAATLSSTGTPSYFIHPAEAVHGDLGAIQPSDVLLVISHSGETPEILRLLETIRRLGARLIALTGTVASTLGEASDVTLDCGVSSEACPLNLAPTASTTAALALGDALAMALLVSKGFREEDFAHLHPGGQLGKRLLRVERLMHAGSELPTVTPSADDRAVIATIGSGGFGMACVVDDDRRVVGIITDGDLRRHLADASALQGKCARDLMTGDPVTIGPATLAVDALNRMERERITSLIVVDDDQYLLGVVHLHDLWRTELF
jgi:arabinose-5-phosphate isomerase